MLTIALAVTGVAIYDSTIDHMQEVCPLVSIFGCQHQVNAINSNRENRSSGIQANYVDFAYLLDGKVTDNPFTETMDSGIFKVIENNKLVYYVPVVEEGLTSYIRVEPTIQIEDGKKYYCYPIYYEGTVVYARAEVISNSVVITEEDVIYPDSANPGDIIHKNDLSYENGVVTRILRLN